MSNKRIQKKRAKAELQRDKSKVIANLVVLMEPGLTRSEYRKIAAPLWKLDMDALFEISFHVLQHQFIRSWPLLKITPRKAFAGEIANWRPIISQYGGLIAHE